MQTEDQNTPTETPAGSSAPSALAGDEARQPAAPERCSNCGAERVGAYCHNCGQQFLEGRLTLRRLWSEFAARFLNLEQGFGRTLWELFTDPGGVARRYVEGERRRYTNPLSYFLFATAVSLLTFTVVDQAMIEEMARVLPEDFGEGESMQALFGPDPAQGYAEFVVGTIKQFNTYLSIFLCIPFALLLRLFFRNITSPSISCLRFLPWDRLRS